jgi:hypothetical protein
LQVRCIGYFNPSIPHARSNKSIRKRMTMKMSTRQFLKKTIL